MRKIEIATIIGAGPAGMAAALQLQRYRIHPLLLERTEPGGLLKNANLVENYPGFPGGIKGPDLVKLFIEQLEGTDVIVTHGEVRELSHEGNSFVIKMASGYEYLSKSVVIASGTKPLNFKDFTIPEIISKKIGYEVYPLLHTQGKTIAIIGAGDAAFDYAINLARQNRVIILNRRTKVSCLPLLWERVKKYPQISYHANVRVDAIEATGDGAIRLLCDASGSTAQFEVDNLIGAIGREPQLDFLSEGLSDKIQGLEQKSRLYLIGDVKNGFYRQTAIAIGDAIKVAMQIYKREVS
jgi:thioredoxin reductase (NADPH)